ncbi:acyltransferase family protein [Clostridium thermobutyricum]|uniref:acyltransferase family protein n=1 Tax=Clostridium thermobutyricum TaxID=29372 RepID=UPI0029421ABD|nr:acyltransferase family protein [Clostridium thermobutyricum]
MDKSITLKKSRNIKVISVFMMLWLHLFGHPDRISKVEYISLLNLGDKPGAEVIASFMGICVTIFLFISGYGIYTKYKENFELKDIKKIFIKIYLNYIIVFSIFLFIGFLLGKYKFQVNEFISNLLTISNSYNREWWFLNTYLLLIMSYILGKNIVKKYNFKKSILFFISLNFIGLILTKLNYSIDTEIYILRIVADFMTVQIFFYSGILVAKYGVFDKINEKIKMKKFINVIMIMVITGILIFKISIPIIDNYIYYFIEIIYIFLLVNLIDENMFINKLSKHTTNIWLTHTFFCYYIFQKLTFLPKYSVLIFLWNLILCLCISNLINKILEIIKIRIKDIRVSNLFIKS